MLRAVRRLCRRDPHLARVVATHGPPPLWARPPGFATLVRIVLEQQVSLASAKAAFGRLQTCAGRVSARRLAGLSPTRITAFGITRQKAAFIHGLAVDVRSGNLNLRTLARFDDPTARSILIRARGIGPWTADIYMIMALRRRDVWPDSDLALLKSMKSVKGLRSDPSPEAARRIAESWAPWRSVAARILWHDYLARRRK
jgi:DNA-3-methyladenine glycosylase II